MSKSKKIRLAIIILAAVAVLLAIVLGVLIYINSSKKPSIPDGYMGNTSGNTNNHGLFCEKDGWIYFANTEDHSKLYKMKTDLSSATKLSEVPVEYINVFDNMIYFYQTPGSEDQIYGLGGLYGICYTDTDGKTGLNSIDKTICNGLILYGPNLYYQHYEKSEGLTLYKAKPDDSGKEKISDLDINISCPLDGRFICYNKKDQYYLSAYNEETNNLDPLSGKIQAYNIIKEGDYLYYMNVADHYKIYRYSLSSGSIEQITDFTVDIFNVYGNDLFAQRNSETEPALVHMNADGSSVSVVAEGNYTDINCTSTYTFFHIFKDNSATFYAPTSGGSAQVLRPTSK